MLLPVGEYYESKPEEINNFVPENTPTDGKYCYVLNIDIQRETDDNQ